MKQRVLETKQQGAKYTFPRRPEKVLKVSGCPIEFLGATATILSSVWKNVKTYKYPQSVTWAVASDA